MKMQLICRGLGLVIGSSALAAGNVFAQLTDVTQTSPSVSGGVIGKSLDQQVGPGQGDEFTTGSSAYLIRRDPFRAIRRGRQLFQRKFTANQGLGPRVSGDASGDIMANPALGAALSDSCAGCHGRPRGAAGFGGDVVTRPDSRDAPHLFGLGLQEMLADEMTADLRAIRDQAILGAQVSGGVAAQSGEAPPPQERESRRDDRNENRRPRSEDSFTASCNPKGANCESQAPLADGSTASIDGVTRRLQTKGIDFGTITAFADGSVDTSRIEGVDPDLRVRPFFHHGGTISIREFAVGAFNAEMGLQSPDPILCAATDPSNPQAVMTASGMLLDPEQDSIERPAVCDRNEDGDGDGVVNELDPALIDHMEFYLLNYFKPGTGKETRRSRRGLRLMQHIGCTSCHVRDLTIDHDRRVADVETAFDPENGIFNRLFATATPLFETVDDGEPYAQLLPSGDSFVVRNIFTDFKRHDLGPNFHEREHDGTLRTAFLTEALWGVGSTAPYGHDGRSINLEEVILRHGGEAQESRDAFARLHNRQREMVLAYLQTLVLFPPDDTASNLNPGDSSGHPQDPAAHGNINLGALFQIESEGAE